MTERRTVDLRQAVPEPPDGLLSLPALHRKIRARRGRQSAVAVIATVIVVAGTIFAVTQAGSGSSPPVSQPATHDGAIVFARLSHGRSKYLPNAALYSTTPTGTTARKLTATSGRIDQVAASPDGREIAYAAETYGYHNGGKDWHVTGDYVHVINADGSGNRTVYRCSASACFSLDWSPVGGRLLINDEIVLEPNGHLDKLCRETCAPGDTLSGASWSPDGQQIAFEDTVDVTIQGGTATVSAIGTANADGTHIQLLTDRQCTTATQSRCTYDSTPAWSSNGDEIAFARLKPNFLRLDSSLGLNPTGPTGIYTMRPDGTAITELTSCGSRCGIESIQWAAQGDRLAFVSTKNPRIGTTSPSTVGVADTSTHRVGTISVRTVSEPNDQSLVPTVAWAPSGRQLALDNHEPGNPAGLYLIPLNHTGLGTVATLIRRNAYPPLSWLPATT